MTTEEAQAVLAEMRSACEYGDGDDGGEEDGGVDALIGYKDMLENAYATLLCAAPLPEAIRRIQNMRDEAAAYFAEHDVPGEWLDHDGSWKDWESESEGSAAEAKRDALDAALDVLQILAHGGAPEQGSTPQPPAWGWTWIEGEDDEAGNSWIQIGPLEDDGDGILVQPEEVAVIMCRDFDRVKAEHPEWIAAKERDAERIVAALNGVPQVVSAHAE